MNLNFGIGFSGGLWLFLLWGWVVMIALWLLGRLFPNDNVLEPENTVSDSESEIITSFVNSK